MTGCFAHFPMHDRVHIKVEPQFASFLQELTHELAKLCNRYNTYEDMRSKYHVMAKIATQERERHEHRM